MEQCANIKLGKFRTRYPAHSVSGEGNQAITSPSWPTFLVTRKSEAGERSGSSSGRTVTVLWRTILRWDVGEMLNSCWLLKLELIEVGSEFWYGCIIGQLSSAVTVCVANMKQKNRKKKQLIHSLITTAKRESEKKAGRVMYWELRKEGRENLAKTAAAAERERGRGFCKEVPYHLRWFDIVFKCFFLKVEKEVEIIK